MKEFIEKAKAEIRVDGLLHIMACCILMLALVPVFYAVAGFIITSVIALLKEAYDWFIKKTSTKDDCIHDLLCDAIGIIAGEVILLSQILINILIVYAR